MLKLLNAIAKHPREFVKFAKLFLIVYWHAIDQQDYKTWGHNLQDGQTLGNRKQAVSLEGYTLGEVLYKGNGGIIEAVKMWIESPTHNTIIADPANVSFVALSIPIIDNDHKVKQYIVVNTIK